MAYVCQTNNPLIKKIKQGAKNAPCFIYTLATVIVAGVAAWVARVATAVVVITAAKYAVVAGAQKNEYNHNNYPNPIIPTTAVIVIK